MCSHISCCAVFVLSGCSCCVLLGCKLSIHTGSCLKWKLIRSIFMRSLKAIRASPALPWRCDCLSQSLWKIIVRKLLKTFKTVSPDLKYWIISALKKHLNTDLYVSITCSSLSDCFFPRRKRQIPFEDWKWTERADTNSYQLARLLMPGWVSLSLQTNENSNTFWSNEEPIICTVCMRDKRIFGIILVSS